MVRRDTAHWRRVKGEVRSAPKVEPVCALRALGGSPVSEEPPSSSRAADQLGFVLGCPLSDVEPMNLRKVPSTGAREELVAKTRVLWKEETGSPKMGVQPLPPIVDCSNVREFLKGAQAEPYCSRSGLSWIRNES